MSSRARLIVLLSLLAVSAQAGDVVREAAGGDPRVLVRVVADGDGLVLQWPNGDPVALELEGETFAADIPPELVADLAERSVMAVSADGRLATLSRDRIRLVRTDDDRWVVADLAGAPTQIPAAPGSLRVPSEDEAPPIESAASVTATALSVVTSLDVSGASPEPVAGASSRLARDLAREALEDPETLNTALVGLVGDQHGLLFLKDVDWKLKTFEAEGETSLGVWFAYDTSRKLWENVKETKRGVSGLGYDIAVEGNVAFDADVNPADFLDVRLGLDYFRSSGGTRGSLSQDQQQRAAQLALSLAAAPYEEVADLLASDDWSEAKQLSREVLSTQVYWDLGLDAGFESDQSFEARNFTVGAHAALDVKAWNDRSALAYLNVLDYPAALGRFLTGYDRDLRPRGSALPTFLLRLDHVEPDGDTPRKALGVTSAYRRVRGEIVYKAPLARLRDSDYFLVALYRTYYEIDAPAAVKAAELDFYDYVSLAFEADDGPFVSYSHGRQPFDDGDADIYELGWKFDF